MSLHNLAHHVRDKGRGKDSMLVHMTPREVQGLQALAKSKGGTLTTNPETGLPEAGFLDDVLPIVAMAAATYFTAGAAAPALSTALGSTMAGGIAAGSLAGAGVGAIGAAAQDKDVGQGALYGGIGGAISGGMGAYDGAASADLFTSGSAASGTPTLTPEAVNKVALDASVTGQIPGASGAPINADVFSGLAGQPTVPPGTMPPVASANPGFTPVRPDAASQGITGVGSDLTTGTAASSAPSVSPSSGASASRIINSPPSGPTYYSTMGLPGKTMTQALPGLAASMGMDIPQEISGFESYSSKSTLSPNFRGYTPERPNPHYRAQYTRYAASGGLMDAYQAGGPVERMSQMNTAMNPQGGLYPQGMIDKTQYATPTQRPVSAELLGEAPAYEQSSPMLMAGGGDTRKKKRASLTADRTLNSLDSYNAALAQLNNARSGANMSGISALNPAMTSLGDLPVVAGAKGGIADLGGYSDGGRMLKGPGDGMSDSIPATIGRRQPARLADGEFVVPADVVSHLGNGSTDAGARKLYAMMDKIRKARTGKKKQAPALNTGRFMPA
jgi:hypothetical protein